MTANLVISWNESYISSVITLLYTINGVSVENWTAVDVEKVNDYFHINLIDNPIMELNIELGNTELIGLPFAHNHHTELQGLYTRNYFNL